jgi:hypothetical protein
VLFRGRETDIIPNLKKLTAPFPIEAHAALSYSLRRGLKVGLPNSSFFRLLRPAMWLSKANPSINLSRKRQSIAMNNHPIKVRPNPPFYRFAATALSASMWFFVSAAIISSVPLAATGISLLIVKPHN